MKKQKILIPLDGSTFSRAIFATVQNLFAPESVELVLFEAIDPEVLPFLDSEVLSLIHI